MSPAATSRTHRRRYSDREAILRDIGAPVDDAGGDEDEDDFDRDLPGGNSPMHDAALREAREARAARAKSEADARAKHSTDRERTPTRRPRGAGSPRGRRRAGRATIGNPTGGRLPIRFDMDGLGGLFAGAVFYALALSVVEYGIAGPKLWFKAKFLNEAAGPSGSTPPPAAGASSTAPTTGRLL